MTNQRTKRIGIYLTPKEKLLIENYARINHRSVNQQIIATMMTAIKTAASVDQSEDH